MTPREGFRFGFLYRCAEEGLNAEEAVERARQGVEKRAFDPVSTVWEGAKTLGSLGISSAKSLGALGLAAGVAAPMAVGGGIGLGLANAQEHDIDPEEVRKQELIATYQFHADQARRRAMLQKLRAGGPLG